MSRPWDPYAPAAPHQQDPTPPGDDLDTLTKAQLIDRAEAAGLSTSGTKAELVERLRAG
jgi:hypothetical protein